MKCPCGCGPLNSRQWEGAVEVDECPACRGVWLDAGELARIQESVDRPHIPESDPADAAARRALRPAHAIPAPRTCPKCLTPLNREEYAHSSMVMVDICGNCGGVFLDRHELDLLETIYEQEHAGIVQEEAGFGFRFREFLAGVTNRFPR